MAKRASADEQPYRPLLDASLVSAAISQASTPPNTESGRVSSRSRIVDVPMPEPTRRIDQVRGDTPILAQAPQPKTVLFEKFDQEKRVLFTRAETQAIDRLVTSLANRLNTQVKVSHVMRALVALLLNAERFLDSRAGEVSPLIRPPNGDALALQRFEMEIAKVIALAMKDAGPVN